MEEESTGDSGIISKHKEDGMHNSLLPWDLFSNWLHCACVVTFDLELGQAMELIYPSHVKLTEKEKSSICYLSFPDSNSGCMGDTHFHFRIRQCPGRRQTIPAHCQYNRDCPVSLQTDNAHYYGFVYFRQTKDRSIRRGYFQKSVVLISRLPFVALFTQLVSIIAPEYFDNGEPSLEAACHDIDQWPAPLPGDTLNLPIMGTVLQVRISSRTDKLLGYGPPRSQQRHDIPAHTILPSLHEVDIYSAFESILSHMQLLWELVLIAEPIVVMAASPTVTSNCVQALINLIAPLRYCSDFRPYFTIHDSEFKEYTTKIQAPPSIILGVTNPFFAKTLQHWPHIIRIGEMGALGSSPKPANKLKKASSLKTLDSKPGVYTRFKTFLSKDKGILKRLIKGSQTKRPVEAQNAILRRHFLELTQSFMIPLIKQVANMIDDILEWDVAQCLPDVQWVIVLIPFIGPIELFFIPASGPRPVQNKTVERYMASLMPLQRNISPHKAPPHLRPFDPNEFLQNIETSGPQLTSGTKGDWEGLYRRFFRSSNFEGWYNERQQDVNQKLEILHMEVLCSANLLEWTQNKEEVEIVDLILRLREKLTFACNNQLLVAKDSVEKLQRHLDTISSALPEDLQSVLKT